MKLQKLLNAIEIRLARLRTKVIYSWRFNKIGNRTALYSLMGLSNPHRIKIGSGVLIRKGARLEVVENLSLAPLLKIGDNVSVEQNVHLVCGLSLEIGDNVTVAANSSIFDIYHDYKNIHSPIKSQKYLLSSVKIGAGSFVGIGSAIHPGVTIGRNCFIGANSVVTKSIPDYCVAVGVPARIIKHYSESCTCWIDGAP